MSLSPGREKTDIRRRQVVAVARKLLADIPLGELTTRQIARQLEISQPALFRHFRCRDDILLAVVDTTKNELGAVTEGLIERGGGATRQLEALAAALLHHVAQNPGLPRLLFANVASGEGPVLAAIHQLHSMQLSLVAELVRQGQQEGELDPSIDARDAALMFVGFLQSATLTRRLEPRSEPLETEGRRLFALWLRGVVSHSPAPRRAAVTERAPAREDGLREIDLRPILERGVDPLDTVMAAVDEVGPSGVVKLGVPFRPAPLIALLTSRGHAVRAERGGPRSWSVEIVCGGEPVPEDLRDLEPPEPLERVLEATSRLSPERAYLARLPRHPRMLLPHLRQRGLRWAVVDEADGTTFLRVFRPR